MTASKNFRAGARTVKRRRHDLDQRVGAQIRELREDAGLARPELAACAGIAASYLWKIEAGAAHPTIEVLIAIGACLGSDLGIRYFPGVGPRLHDRFQAPMVEALLRALGPGWRGEPEVAVPSARGVIDLVLRRPQDRLVLACEAHSELRRLELVVRRLGEKAEALKAQIEGERAVSRMVLLRSTTSTRAVAQAYEATLAAAFPSRTAEAVAALRGEAAWPGPAIVWARVEAGRAEIMDAPPRGVRVGR
jgi:transcriptional regulator with XRE-family HTH domain